MTLSPSGVVQVCSRLSQQLDITCTTNETFLVWNFVPPLVNSQGISVPQNWFITSIDQSQQLQQLTVNSTSFTIRRTSIRNVSPLVSILTIINSSSALDMIEIRCTEIVGNERATAVSSTIQVIADKKIGNYYYDHHFVGPLI